MNIRMIVAHESQGFLRRFPNAIYLDTLHANEMGLELIRLLKENKGEDMLFVTVRETIVNFFGHLVAHNYLDEKDIEVILVFEDGTIVYPFYNKDGYLQDWPWGYFTPDCYDDIERLGLKKKS